MEVEMDASGVHHHLQQQEVSSQTLESMLVCTKAQQEKKPRPAEQALKCPRCDSTNTKFCYYNNYSLTQPRYFCKSCRRYWTKGGTLRNVPVGGGCRKNKRSSSSSSSSSLLASVTSSNSTSSSSILSKIRGTHDHLINQNLHQPLNSNNLLVSGLTHLPYDSTCTDLSLAFARLQNQANGHLGFDHFDQSDNLFASNNSTSNPTPNPPTTPHDDDHGFLDAIRGSFLGNAPNGYHNMIYTRGNLGNGDMGSVENCGVIQDYDQEVMNPIYHDQEHAGTMAAIKQETCHELGENRGSAGGVLWGFPFQMGDQGMNMVHEVESLRSSQIAGGWNGLGSTAWHGLLNSPLM